MVADVQVGFLNRSDGDLKLKELVLAVLARFALLDDNVDVVFSILHKIDSGYVASRVMFSFFCMPCALLRWSAC